MNYYDFPMHQQAANPLMIHQQQTQSGLPPYPNGSPQRRFLSEGELLSRTTSNGLTIGNELSYVNRTNNTADNIRELAGSPQRGVYNWKDNSPPGYNNPNQMPMYGVGQQQPPPQQQQQANISNNFIGRPPLPTSQQQQQQYLQNQNMTVVTSAQQQPPNVRQSNVNAIINNIVANSANQSNYHPALRGGVQVFPPQIPASPQVKRKQTPTRPISFVRALEMANSIEMTNTSYQQQQSDQGDVNMSSGGGETNPNIQQNQQIVDRGSIYDTNYEISVWSAQMAGNLNTTAGSERLKMIRKESVDKYWRKVADFFLLLSGEKRKKKNVQK